MTWNFRTLDSLLAKSGTSRAGNRDYPVLSITMRDGLVDQAEKFKKRVASQNTSQYRVAFRNELVVGFPIDEGVLGFQTKYPAGIVSPAYDIWKLKEPVKTYIPYLERYLRSTQARLIYASKMQGAVARRRSLTKADFLGLEIPYPPFDDQKRIAHLLDKVEGLIARRKQHLQQLDDLLKSFFLEMFGDPVRNEKGWDVRPCDKVVTDIKSGTSYGGEDKDFLDNDEYGVLKISAVTQGYFNPHEFKAVKKSVISKPLRFIQKGDFLFSRANTIELVAACCIVPEDSDDLFLPDKLWVLSLDESVNIQFFNYLLKNENFRNLVRKQASGGHDSMLNISMKKFRSLNVPVPDEGLQNQFAAIVEKVEDLKSRYQQSLADLEHLYGALSQKAFKGELDLSRVVVTMDKEEPAEIMEPITPALPDTQPGIELPAPDSVGSFFSAKDRKVLISLWFKVYLERLGSTPFSAQHFMETAKQRLVELLEEVQEPESLSTDYDFFQFGPNEYDHVKELIFQALESGRLTQAYDGDGNRVQLNMVKG